MNLIILSSAFYVKYGECKEILKKPSRPYVCLKIAINGVCFAIPFRHHIAHKYAFFTHGESGLDYTKAVVISDKAFISYDIPRIEQKDFNALKGKDNQIRNGLSNYIKLYKDALRYNKNPNYEYILKYSALQYFKEKI